MQRVLELRNSPRRRQRELELRLEVEDTLKHEELLWFQKSRSTWLVNGDRNTKYFHSLTLTRCQCNKNEGLKIDDGEWCFNDAKLKHHVMGFFKQLYTVNYVVGDSLPSKGKFPHLLQVEKDGLGMSTSDVEIRKAVFDMDPLKTLGVDGFDVKFYQSQWDIVGSSVFHLMRWVMEGHPLDKRIHRTLIALIPKIQGPEKISQLNPISLCSVVYKIITKTIVNRLRLLITKWVRQNQASFVMSRNIANNIIVTQEVVHSKKFKGIKYGMILKIDLEKTYDRLKWDFFGG